MDGIELIEGFLGGMVTILIGLIVYIWKSKDRSDILIKKAIDEIKDALPKITVTLEDIKETVHKVSSDLEKHKEEYYHTREEVTALKEFKKYAEIRLRKLEKDA